jgi:nicotinate-nucleotide adenylyltransferase
MTAARLGVFGGTFDPIHFGHLDAAAAVQRTLAIDQVLVVPSLAPPHRATDPRATMFHRFAMAVLAIDGLPGYRVSDLELGRTGPSYTYDTLRALHAQGWSPSQLFFIIGTDAFAEIAQWREFSRVVEGTNFAVVGRTGVGLDHAVGRTPSLRGRVRALDAAPEPSAKTGVYLIEAATRDISSTLIRARLAERRPISDLVPPGVERHIIRHGLYGAVDELHISSQSASVGH